MARGSRNFDGSGEPRVDGSGEPRVDGSGEPRVDGSREPRFMVQHVAFLASIAPFWPESDFSA